MEIVNSLVQSPWVQPLVALLMGIALLVYVRWRAGSIRGVLDRLWHLLAGHTDVNDPILKELLVNSRDLERFRFTYRLKVNSLADVHKLHGWSVRHQMDLSNLTAVRDWVDLKHSDLIKEPPKSHFVIETLTVGVLTVLVLISGALLLPSGALLQTKGSGVYFRAQEAGIEHPFRRWKYSAADCQSDLDTLVSKSGFTRNEATLMCAALKEGKIISLIDENQSMQRWLFAFGVLFPIAPFIFSGVWKVTAAQAALAIRSKTVEVAACSQQSKVEPATLPGEKG